MIDLRFDLLAHTNGRLGFFFVRDAICQRPPKPEDPAVAPRPPEDVYMKDGKRQYQCCGGYSSTESSESSPSVLPSPDNVSI